MYRWNQYFNIFTLILGLFAIAACSGGETSSVEAYQPSDNEPQVEFHHLNVNSFKLNKVVCDPMGGSGNPGLDDGLIAELFYLDQTVHQHSQVQDFFDQGTRSTQDLFFTELNVPTRVFDTGFPSQTGSMIKNDDGEELIEYFALRFKSVLKLGPDDEEGDYELALLSDDGALLKVIDIDGDEHIIVDNDGLHPTRFGCSSTKVTMSKDTALDVRLEYFQGPRQHISLIPMWRRIDGQAGQDKECGKQGNERYFNYNNNSEPQKNYTDLLARGWKPIATDNWELPNSSIFNPCTEGTNAKILNFSIEKQGETQVVVSWETDIPATAQVLVKDSQGGEWMTDSDNGLRTSHRVVVDNLPVGRIYTFQGVAITSDLGKTLSRVLQVTL